MHSFIQNAFTEHLAVLGKEDNTAEVRTVPTLLNESPSLMAHSLSPGSSPALGLISFPIQPMGASLIYLTALGLCCGTWDVRCFTWDLSLPCTDFLVATRRLKFLHGVWDLSYWIGG